MTIPELHQFSLRTLEFGIERIREGKGDLHQQFHLIGSDSKLEVIVVGDGDLTNSRAGKDAVSRVIRERVSQGNVEAVIMLSDTYYSADLTPQNALLMRTLGMTLEEAARARLCTYTDAVLVATESPIYCERITQPYKRHGDGTIELTGERKIVNSQDNPSMALVGRMTNWFSARKGAEVKQ